MRPIPYLVIILCFWFINSHSQNHIENHIIVSKHLNESRTIAVALPDNYQTYTKDYPVLFVLDGEYAFNYAQGTASFLSNDFGFLPKMIVVSIPNTNRGRDMDIAFNDKTVKSDFVAFLENELLPFIDNRYRTNGFSILYGWSSSASICDYLMVKKPELFDAFIATGAGVGPKTAKFMMKHLNREFKSDKFLYVNVEGNSHRKPGFDRYQHLIDSINPIKLNKKFEYLENANHVNVMALGIYNGLQFVFNDFYIPENTYLNGFSAIQDYYKNLENRYHFTIEIPEGAIVEMSGVLFYKKKSSDGLKLIEYGLSVYPNASALYGALGEYYEYYEPNPKLAKANYQKALEKAKGNTINELKYRALVNSFD